MLLDAAEELVGVQFVFAGSRAAQQPDVQDHDIAAARLDAIEDVAQMIEIEVVANGHEDVAGPRADGLGRQLGFQLQVELVHLHVSRAASMGAALGDGENYKKQDREGAARHGGDRFGEEVDDGDEKEGERDQTEPDRNLHAANVKIERDLKLAHSRPGVAKNENGQAVHRETPDDAEGIEVRKKSDIAAADKNGDDLQKNDNIDDAVACAEPRMRLPEPRTENAVLGNAIQHTVRTDD